MVKVFEAFAGIGTQRMALKRLGVEHEVVGISEIDKFAISSYEAIHGETRNYGDISKIIPQNLPEFDLFTYSFPCQDISVAGEGRGLETGSGTRSSLLWDCQDIIEAKRPKYLLMENVKNLVSKKHKAQFDKWLDILSDLGYTNYWQVLNAKDYGVPQNRERVFVVSILGDHRPYEFPKKKELETRLKDVLLEDVEDKFYLSQEQIDKITFSKFNQEKSRIQTKDYSDTLCARDYKDPKCVPVRIGGMYDTDKQKRQAGAIWDKEAVSPTIDTMQGGYRQPIVLDDSGSIKIKNATQKGYQEAKNGDIIDLTYPNSKTKRGRVKRGHTHTITTKDTLGVLETVIGASRGRNPENPTSRETGLKTRQQLEVNEGGTSNCITTVQKDNLVVQRGLAEYGGEVVKIRKLVPQECWRLMGIDDKDFLEAQKVNSNSQLYKQAGNAIVVDVLEVIFNNLPGIA